jgi:thiamine biosynthesis lipoprotein
MNPRHLLFFLLLLVSCSKENAFTKHHLQGAAFGTTYNIVFYGSSDTKTIQKGIDSVITRVNKSVSTYLYNSDISKINRGDSTLVTDTIFRTVFNISKNIYKLTDGYFDPTIGVLRNAYGFGDTKPIQKLNKLTIDSLMQFVGFDKVQHTPEGNIKKQHPQIYLDFNAIAKGYGIDCIGNYLSEKGITNYLIELGGEILTKGTHPETQKPWIVGIESVTSDLDNRSIVTKVALQNAAMATSGNYRKYRVDSITGRKFVHTINPKNGMAEPSDVTSASVIAATCAEADAYATSFMALGLEKSKNVLKKLKGIEVYLTFIDSLHTQQVFMSPGFKKYLINP